MLQRKGQLPAEALCLAVPDPSPELGSGGVTLNALLVAAEHLSAAAGHTAVSILLVHCQSTASLFSQRSTSPFLTMYVPS